MGLMLPPGLVRRDELTAYEVRCWDADLEALCASVDDVFRRPASWANLRAMVRGLLSDVPRKNMWQVAEAAGHASPDRLQDFLARAVWDADELRDRVREFVVDSLRAEDAVLIADETGDIKKGTKSAGVDRQYTGVTGQVGNAQVSVLLSYGSSRGRAIIDRELYAGQHWAGRGEEHRRRSRRLRYPRNGSAPLSPNRSWPGAWSGVRSRPGCPSATSWPTSFTAARVPCAPGWKNTRSDT